MKIIDIQVVEVEKRRVPSKHYVYVIVVKWSDENSMVIYRRYSRFFDLQTQLLDKFPIEGGTTDPTLRIIPFLPGKIFFGRSHVREVAMKRLKEIDTYCKSLISLPPHISQCEEVLMFFEVQPEDLDPPKLEVKPKPGEEKKAEKISSPKRPEQYLVLADYIAQEKGEINIQGGTIVEVVEKSDKGWWFVTAEDQQGWVPSTYLQPVGDSISKNPTQVSVSEAEDLTYICIETYTAQNADELSLEKGVVVEVLQKNMDGWWQVRYKGQEGFAPATYLMKTKDPYAKSLVEKSRVSGVQIITNLSDISNIMSGSGTSPRNSAFLSTSKDNSSAHSPWPSELNNKNKLQDNYTNSKKNYEEDDDDEWDEVEESRPQDKGHRDSSHVPVFIKQKSLERGGSLRPPPRQNSIKHLNNLSPPLSPPARSSTYVTVADFEDTVGDGISFQAGEFVTVLEKASSGWWFVKRGQEEGWVPESYLELSEDSSIKNKQEKELLNNADEKGDKHGGHLVSHLSGHHLSSSKSDSQGTQDKSIAKPKLLVLPNKPSEQTKSSGVLQTSSAKNSGENSAPPAGIANALKSKFETSTSAKSQEKSTPSLPKKPQENLNFRDANREGNLVNAMKAGFESQKRSDKQDQSNDPVKPSFPTSKPALPSKIQTNTPVPPNKMGSASQKPAIVKKPLPSNSNDAADSQLLSSNAAKSLGGPPKLPTGLPKLPSKTQIPKSSIPTSDKPASSTKVHDLAAALNKGVSNEKERPKPTLPVKKTGHEQKSASAGLQNTEQNKHRVGNIVSELSGKLNFGSGPKMPHADSSARKTQYGSNASSEDMKPIPCLPTDRKKGFGPMLTPFNAGDKEKKPEPPQYQAVVDYNATRESDVSLVSGDIVEVLDKQE